ncbi:MAG TPA: ATP-binding protein, partial [Marmoricola sp.]|nr:ATP-binding protein [Marmoricola sp.]
AGDHVEIQVADRGPGLAVEEDPFARGVRGHSSNGSGLGLAVARTLMRQQGGDLLLHPCPTGAMFSARLPLSRRRPIAAQRRRELGPVAEVAACRP